MALKKILAFLIMQVFLSGSQALFSKQVEISSLPGLKPILQIRGKSSLQAYGTTHAILIISAIQLFGGDMA